MEFFIPGLLFFIVSIGITFMIAPNATPIMAAILSIIFLTFGVYQHYKLFAYEYRLSTWQEGLKIYSPAIMLFAIILYIIYGMLAFFTGGVVPVPNVNLPSVNDVTSQITNSINNVTESITNTANNVISLNNKGNSITNSIATSLGVNNKNKKNNNLSRSFLETV
jgi:predicted PurR-regulated permease PerM